MASLAASRASRSQPPESASDLPIPETAGLSLPEWYGTLLRASASLRTSQALTFFGTTGRKSDHAFKQWASGLRRESSQRRRSAPRTFGSASSGSALDDWPTPTAVELGNSMESYEAMKANMASGPREAITSLKHAAQSWPTPSAAPDAPNTNSNQVNGPTSLGEAAKLWPTARAEDAEVAGGHRGTLDSLHAALQAWPTPQAADSDRTSPTFSRGESNPTLQGEAQLWPTPNVPNGGRTSNTSNYRKDGSKQQADLGAFAQSWPTARHNERGQWQRDHGEGPRRPTLDGTAQQWAPPRTITGGPESAERKQELGRTESGGGDLQAQAQMWATPQHRDYKSPGDLPNRVGSASLSTQSALSRRGQETPPDGSAGSPSGRVLNPRLGWE